MAAAAFLVALSLGLTGAVRADDDERSPVIGDSGVTVCAQLEKEAPPGPAPSWRPFVNLAVLASSNLDLGLGTSEATGASRCKDTAFASPDMMTVAECGSTTSLIEKALEEAAVAFSPDALILVGSLSAKRYNQSLSPTLTYDELDALSNLVESTNATAFPTVAVAPGAADFPGFNPGYFDLNPLTAPAANAKPLAELGAAIGRFLPWVTDPQDRMAQLDREAFESFGAYAVNVSGSAPVVIVNINSALMIDDLRPHNADFFAARKQRSLMDEQLDWLDKRLASIAQSRNYAVIVGEASFGVDVGIDGEHAASPRRLWAESATEGFRAVLDKHCSTVVAMVFAEVFHAQIRVLSSSTCDTPMLSVAGLAPLKGNNPTITSITVGLCKLSATSWSQTSIGLLENSTNAVDGIVNPSPTSAPPAVPATPAPGTPSNETTPAPFVPTPPPAPPPVFTLVQDIMAEYGGCAVDVVRSTLTTLLQRTKANDFANLRAASAGGAPRKAWTFSERRALICSQLHSELEKYMACAAMCDPLSAAWASSSWSDFPPPVQFLPAPYILLATGTAVIALLYLPFAFFLQRSRMLSLLRASKFIAESAPDAAESVSRTWTRVHRSSSTDGALDGGADNDSVLRPAGAVNSRQTSFGAGGTFSQINTFLVIDDDGNEAGSTHVPIDRRAAAHDATSFASRRFGGADGTTQLTYMRMDTRDERTGERTDELLEWDAVLEAFHSRYIWFRRGAMYRWARWSCLPGPPNCDADRLFSLVVHVADARVALHKAAVAAAAEKKYYDEGHGDTRIPADMARLEANLRVYERVYVELVRTLADAYRQLVSPRSVSSAKAGDGRLVTPHFGIRAPPEPLVNPPPPEMVKDDERHDGRATDLLLGVVAAEGLVTASPLLTLCDSISLASDSSSSTAATPQQPDHTAPSSTTSSERPMAFRPALLRASSHVRQSVRALGRSLVTAGDVEYATRPSVTHKTWEDAVLRLGNECVQRPLASSVDGDSAGAASSYDAGIPWLWRELRVLRRYHVLYWHKQLHPDAPRAMRWLRLVDTVPKHGASWRGALLPPRLSWFRIVVAVRVFLGIVLVSYSNSELWNGLPECTSHVLSNMSEMMVCVAFVVAAVTNSKAFGLSFVTFVAMWTSITALDSPRQADRTAMWLMALRAAAGMLVFLACWNPSRHRRPIPHPHVTGSSQGGAVAAWCAARHDAQAVSERVVVSPRALKHTEIDGAATRPRGESTSSPLVTPPNKRARHRIDAAFRPQVLDELQGLPDSPSKTEWLWSPDFIQGPNVMATVEMLAICLVSIFNSLAVVYLAYALSTLLETCVSIVASTALPADRLQFTSSVISFVAISVGVVVGQYAVSVAISSEPSRDGTVKHDSMNMPVQSPARGWIQSVYPTSVTLVVLVILANQSEYLFMCGIAFVVLVTGMQYMLALSGHAPQPPWFIASRLSGSVLVYPALAFSQLTAALNVIALAAIALVLVNSADKRALAASSADTLKLMFLLKAFGPAVSAGLAPNTVLVLLALRKRVLRWKQSRVHRLRLGRIAAEQRAAAAASYAVNADADDLDSPSALPAQGADRSASRVQGFAALPDDLIAASTPQVTSSHLDAAPSAAMLSRRSVEPDESARQSSASIVPMDDAEPPTSET